MEPKAYEYLPAGKVQCPKCGSFGELALYSNTGYTLAYAGVCQAEMQSKVLCGATLVLEVTAHPFPRQPT